MHHNLKDRNHKQWLTGTLPIFSIHCFKFNMCNHFLMSVLVIFITVSGIAVASTQGVPTQKYPRVIQIKSQPEITLTLPSDVAVLKDKIYLVDGGNHRVVVYDLQGEYLFAFGDEGNKAGQLNYPVGISAASNGRVYVADSGNHRIQIFSDKGKYLSGFAVKIKGKSIRPIDVMRHKKSGRIIVSGGNHLLTYSSKGRLLKTWGGVGVNQGEFRYPATLAEMSDGRIAVVDVLNSRVQVFNPDGSVSTAISEWGVLPGQLFRPKGVAVDRQDNFYISDSYMGVVQKFSDAGKFKAVLGEQGKPYKMLTPVGMTIYKNRLYIVEMKSNLLSVYQLSK